MSESNQLTSQPATTPTGPSAGASNLGATARVQLKHGLRGHDYATQVQMLTPEQGPPGRGASVHQAAERGMSGSAGKLPHSETIQKSFGGYDISNVQAHTDGAARSASAAMGAHAYASGNHVVLGAGGKDLHTTAHEAAHVVQQRAGVALSGGVGQSGDAYEVHADKVADAVVQGKSAEPLLAEMAGGGQRGAQGGAVQQRHIQLKSAAEEVTTLLSYSLTDVVVTDAEATQALEILGALGQSQLKAEVAAIDATLLSRLLSNLPAAGRQHPAFSRIVFAMGYRGVQQYINSLVTCGVFHWVVTDADIQAVLEILLALGGSDKAALFRAVGASCRDRLVTALVAAGPCSASRYGLARVLFNATPEAELSTYDRLLGWRFNITVNEASAENAGVPWTKAGLRHCWDVFEALPPEHVRGNDAFQFLSRYEADSTEGWANDGDGINAMGYSNASDLDKEQEEGLFTDEGDPLFGKNLFDATVRHEVGHLVDASSGGAGYCATTDGGEWLEHGAGGGLAATMVAASGGALSNWADVAQGAALVAVLQDALLVDSTDSVEEDFLNVILAGRDVNALADDETAEIVAAHTAAMGDDAVKALSVAFESNAPWDSATGGVALDGRIYQEGYSNTWNSYKADARTKKVSRYQFRTAAEWFAEAYAAYYQPPGDKGTFLGGVDPTSKAWFDTNVDPKGGKGSTTVGSKPKPKPKPKAEG